MHNQFERQSTTAQKDSKRKHRIGRWIGAVLLLLLLILIFVIISNLRSTNYIRDDEVEVMTELLETESEIRTSSQGHRYTHTDYKTTLTPHVLRHGYATLLYEAGVDMYTAQRLLGHADIQTTMTVYTHLRERQEQASVGRLISHVQDAMTASAAPKKSAG